MLFNSFTDENIEFNDITFISLIEIKKNIHLKNYLACLSGVFTVIEGDLSGKSDEIKLKYKRVSNYNEMDSIDSFINEMRKNDEGEVYFDEAEVDSIQEIIQAVEDRTKKMSAAA